MLDGWIIWLSILKSLTFLELYYCCCSLVTIVKDNFVIVLSFTILLNKYIRIIDIFELYIIFIILTRLGIFYTYFSYYLSAANYFTIFTFLLYQKQRACYFIQGKAH